MYMTMGNRTILLVMTFKTSGLYSLVWFNTDMVGPSAANLYADYAIFIVVRGSLG